MGANFEIDNVPVGMTPLKIEVKKFYSKGNLIFNKTGCRSKQVTLSRALDLNFLWNIFNGFGLFVDLMMGTVTKYNMTKLLSMQG